MDLFDDVQKHVMDGVLKLVGKQRNGETIETAMVKSIVDSFVSLGLDENDSTKSTLDVYRKFFELPFLEATTAYYQIESKQFVAENSVVEYMKKVRVQLHQTNLRLIRCRPKPASAKSKTESRCIFIPISADL